MNFLAVVKSGFLWRKTAQAFVVSVYTFAGNAIVPKKDRGYCEAPCMEKYQRVDYDTSSREGFSFAESKRELSVRSKGAQSPFAAYKMREPCTRAFQSSAK
jgi:hypothetical protein